MVVDHHFIMMVAKNELLRPILYQINYHPRQYLCQVWYQNIGFQSCQIQIWHLDWCQIIQNTGIISVLASRSHQIWIHVPRCLTKSKFAEIQYGCWHFQFNRGIWESKYVCGIYPLNIPWYTYSLSLSMFT